MVRTKFSGDSNKNCTFQCLYKGDKGIYPILAMASLNGHPRRLKIESISYTLSEGCEIELFWDKCDPFLVLSGRGFIRFEGGIQCENDTVHVLNFSLNKPGTVCLFMDTEKQ